MYTLVKTNTSPLYYTMYVDASKHAPSYTHMKSPPLGRVWAMDANMFRGPDPPYHGMWDCL